MGNKHFNILMKDVLSVDEGNTLFRIWSKGPLSVALDCLDYHPSHQCSRVLPIPQQVQSSDPLPYHT